MHFSTSYHRLSSTCVYPLLRVARRGINSDPEEVMVLPVRTDQSEARVFTCASRHRPW